MGSVFAGLADLGVCLNPLVCLGYQAVGGKMPSAIYANELNSHGVDTSIHSTYGDGIAFMSILALAAGGVGDAAGVTAADAAADAAAGGAAAGGSASVADSSESGLSKALEEMAEKSKNTGETIGAGHDVAGSIGTGLDDVLGSNPPGLATGAVDLVGGTAVPADYGPSYPNMIMGSAGGFEAAAFVVAGVAAAVAIVIKRALEG
jgi:hypothetical protein